MHSIRLSKCGTAAHQHRPCTGSPRRVCAARRQFAHLGPLRVIIKHSQELLPEVREFITRHTAYNKHDTGWAKGAPSEDHTTPPFFHALFVCCAIHNGPGPNHGPLKTTCPRLRKRWDENTSLNN